MSRDHAEYLEAHIAALDAQVDRVIAPFAEARDHLIGKKKATVAVGHSILVIAWHLLSQGCGYDDLGGDWFTRRADTDRHRDHLVHQLQQLGYGVSLTKIAA